MDSTPAPTAPRISIALATYNGARDLDAQLTSLLAQTFTDFEIVACDDGSTDGTLEILAAHAARDARLKIHPSAGGNLGFNANFARCFALCAGPLIAPCDQDDLWQPGKLAKLLPLLENPDTAIAYADSAFIDDAGNPLGLRLGDQRTLGDLDDPRQVGLANCVSGHAMLFRASLLARATPFPDAGYYDWWLTFVALSLGRRVRYLDEVLVLYRLHTRAVTSSDPSQRRALADTETALGNMARFVSPWQARFQALEKAWLDWRDGFVGLSMGWLVWRHGRKLLGIVGYTGSGLKTTNLRALAKYLVGYRTQRWLAPRRFPTPAARA